MKKLLFLVLVAALSFSTVQAQEKVVMKDAFKTVKTVKLGKQMLNTPSEFVTKFKAPAKADVPEDMALVTLTAGDVWEDGSGYQMLLDADATAYGNLFAETGGLTTGGDASAALYAEFEYKIPENADGSLTTSNIVLNNSVSILIPAGVYDWCITNPTPGDRVWIASSNGNVGGRADDFEFKGGMAYEFTVSLGGQNDQVDVYIPVEGQALTVPEDLTAVCNEYGQVTVSWEDNDDMLWNIRYRVYNPFAGANWDFEDASQLEGWHIWDANEDGDNWYYDSDSYYPHSGTCVLASDSWNYTMGAMDPDNWLITPEVNLVGNLSFWARAYSSSWSDEVFSVYAAPADWETLDDFTPIAENITAVGEWTEYIFDLSEFNGERGVIAIRHHDCYDQMSLLIDDVAIGEPEGEWIVVENLDDLAVIFTDLEPGVTYEAQVQATGENGTSEWTESVLFTPVTGGDPTEKTDAPSSSKENYVYNDGNLYYNAYIVTLTETEPSDIYYRVGIMTDGEYVYGEWMLYTGELNFTEEGTYMIEAYAIAENKLESDHIWDGFTVSKMVDVEELFAGKTVANVRYFNLMGQEMQQANGVTIMVTTFTDGTTNAVKVVK